MDLVARHIKPYLETDDFLNYMLVDQECLIRGSQCVQNLRVTPSIHKDMYEKLEERFCNANISVKRYKFYLFHVRFSKVSKDVLPLWEKLDEVYEDYLIDFVDVDCDEFDYNLADDCRHVVVDEMDFDVQFFPTMLLVQEDGEVMSYTGKRNVIYFQWFLEKETGICLSTSD